MKAKVKIAEGKSRKQFIETLTRQQVADHFNVCTHTVRLWELRGMLHPVRLNARVIRYPVEEINKLILPKYPPIMRTTSAQLESEAA